jgi:hypothetical protein
VTVEESNVNQALIRITSAIKDLACMVPADGDEWIAGRLAMIVESMHEAENWYGGRIK